jgi:large subunit ribosomal protein L15
MPIFRRLPKRGFSNFNFRTEYQVVNLATLEDRFAAGDSVDLERLKKARLVHGAKPLVKVLATGALEKKLTVHAHAFSKKAREAIEKVGGSAQLIKRRTPQEAARAKRNTAKAARKSGKTKETTPARTSGPDS